MAAKLIVVLGATGNQGGSVVKTLLNDPEWKIRGISRNASSEASEKLKAQGVEMVSASLDDVASLEKAFQGAYAIFSVTDFWGLYFNPATHAGKPADVAANEWVKRIEIQQGKNVFDAAAKVEGLQRLVFSSLPNVLNSSGGRIKHVMHFDSKALAVEYGQATYPELWKKTSVILVGLYLSNVLSSPFLEPKKDENGVYIFKDNFRGDRKFPYVAADEDTGPLTKALLQVAPGKTLLAYREMITQDEFVEIWSRTLGQPAKHVFDSHVGGMPEDLVLEFTDNGKYFNDFGYQGTDPSIIYPKDLGVPIDLPTVGDWVNEQDWSKIGLQR